MRNDEDDKAERPPDTALQKLWQDAWPSLQARPWLAQALLLVPVAMVAALFVSPGIYTQQIPELAVEDIGKPFRASSSFGFKANRDFQIVDVESTRLRKEEAAASVRPVFDLDTTVVDTLRRNVKQEFFQMRQAIAAYKGAGRREGDSDLTSRLRSLRGRHPLMEQLDDDDFETLVQMRFAFDIESSVVELLEYAYRAKIAVHRDELNRTEAPGIIVREVSSGAEMESDVSPPDVRDVRETRVEMDQYASVPGNVLPERSLLVRRAVLRMAKLQLRPNLTINTAETEARRKAAQEAVKHSILTIRKGQRVIGDGELINSTHRVILDGMRAQTDDVDSLSLHLGSTGVVASLLFAAFAFMRAGFKRFRPTRKDGLLLAALLIFCLGILQLWVSIADAVHDRYPGLSAEALYFAFPVAAGAMLVRFVLSAELALFFAIVVSALTGMMLGHSLSFGLFSLVGSLVASEKIQQAKDRVGIFRAGVATGLVQMLCAAFFFLAQGQGVTAELFYRAGFAFFSAAVAVPVTVLALTPLCEAAFGYASDIKLLELANLNHPALKELIVQAPGTYHHSIVIGSLVESAAEAIGANPLLARSCAYYHDIGKGRNPVYFGENQKGENAHDVLDPAMSAMIIKRHVTEGLEMARQYKLPRLVADAIPQHHGTRLVGFFYHKALKQQEGRQNPVPVDDAPYRYAGPKPQFREAALVMIADAVEAASRSMPEPTQAKLQALVQKLINMIFSEGQLDECELTLKDLNLIAQSFVRTLEGIYHARPVYPPSAMGGDQPALRAGFPAASDRGPSGTGTAGGGR